MSCGYDCGCDSEEAHDAAAEESMREFLANPGFPPDHFTDEQTQRALRAMDRARKELES